MWKLTKKQKKERLLSYLKILIVGLILFALIFFVATILSNSILEENIFEIIPYFYIVIILGFYFFISVLFGVDCMEYIYSRGNKIVKVFTWLLLPIWLLLAIVIGIIFYIPYLIYLVF